MQLNGHLWTLLIFWFSVGTGHACICNEVSLENELWEGYDEIFIGRVISIERKIIELHPASGVPYKVVGTVTTFEVERKWKGGNSAIIRITQTGSSCSISYDIEDFNYLVTANLRKFANNSMSDAKNKAYLTSEGCNRILSQRIDEVDYLKAIEILDSRYSHPIELRHPLWTQFFAFNAPTITYIIILLIGVLTGFLFNKKFGK